MASRSFSRGTNQRRVADIWLALRTTGSVCVQISLVGLVFIAAVLLTVFGSIDLPRVLIGMLFVWLLGLWFVVRVWTSYYEGVVVDAQASTLAFPASDVENSVLDLMTFRQFFDHARRETLRLGMIERIANETRAKRNHYAVNISGVFGSRQFTFDSKQKRDEFRAAIAWGLQMNSLRAWQDNNSDVGGYGG